MSGRDIKQDQIYILKAQSTGGVGLVLNNGQYTCNYIKRKVNDHTGRVCDSLAAFSVEPSHGTVIFEINGVHTAISQGQSYTSGEFFDKITVTGQATLTVEFKAFQNEEN